MDFLDPQKMRRQNIMLFVGYVLIGIAILITALVLLYQSNGFGINKNGKVIQNGLVFSGSTPSGAHVYLDGEDSGFTTNKRLVLAAGKYVLQFKKDGYHPWSRNITVQGGSVNRFDYAFLFPTQLDSQRLKTYPQTPTLATQSPDRRWVVVQTNPDLRNFDVFDLKDPTKAPVPIAVPPNVLTDGPNQSLQLVEWSNDNSHILLKHSFGTSYEFILVDREAPDQSQNLNKTLGVNPTEIRLVDKKYDRYYLYDQAQKLLQTASLSSPKPLDYLKNVLAYKSYSDNMMLYVSDDIKAENSAPGQLAVKLAVGDQTYTIRKITPGSNYLLEIAKYSGDLYVVGGVNSENKAVVYKNPVDQINNSNIGVAVPAATLKVQNPTFVSFSANTQYMMAESGTGFAVYDAEYQKTYGYSFNNPFDAGQDHAQWMDGNRLTYVSGGKIFVFDYDGTNRHMLMAASPLLIPSFTPDYKRVITLAPSASDGSASVVSTWLRTVNDR